MQNILILGTGNFSELLQRLLQADFELRALSSRKAGDSELAASVAWADAIVLAVPFKGYEQTVVRIKASLKPETLIVDICSVKEKPQNLLHELLPSHNNWLISHPLFGPQSAADDTDGLDLIVCESSGERAKQFVEFCDTKLGLKIVRMTAKEHDLQMSKAQALTFFISEILRGIDVENQELMTPSYKKLLDVRRLVEHESQDLLDLFQHDNEQATQIREAFMQQAKTTNQKYSP